MKKKILYFIICFIFISCNPNSDVETFKLFLGEDLAIINPRNLNTNSIPKDTEITIIALIKKGEKVKHFTVNEEEKALKENNIFKFTITEDVIIKIELEEKKLELNISEGLSIVYPKELNKESIPWGTHICVKISIPENQAINEFKVNGIDKYNSIEENKYSFDIEKDTNISVSFLKLFSLTLGENLSILRPTEVDLEKIKEGTNIDIKAILIDNSAIENFILKDTTTNEEIINLDIQYKYEKINETYDVFAQKSFVMDKNYSISVNYNTNLKVLPANYYEIDDFSDKISITPQAQNNSYSNILIPNFVEFIGDRAFKECNSLESIEITTSVETIGNQAFFGCENLSSIIIPNSIKNIGYGAFQYCNILTSINLPTGIKVIGYSAFSFCTNLDSINIPNTVTSLGEYIFYECENLNSIFIPESVISVGYYAFKNCPNLTKINIQAKEIPSGWNSEWNPDGINVNFNIQE